MATPIIQTNQPSGGGLETTGNGRNDLHTGLTVNISDGQSANSGATYASTLIAPPGSTATLTGAATSTPSFVPDLVGPYVIQMLATVAGTVYPAETIVCVPTAYLGDRLPAFGEKREYAASGNDRGWARAYWDHVINSDAAFSTLNTRITSVEGGEADPKVKVSSDDTTPGYLEQKISAGSHVTLTETSEGGNETLAIGISAYSGADTNAVHSGDAAGGNLSGTFPSPHVTGFHVGSTDFPVSNTGWAGTNALTLDNSGNIIGRTRAGIDTTAIHSGDAPNGATGDLIGTYPDAIRVFASGLGTPSANINLTDKAGGGISADGSVLTIYGGAGVAARFSSPAGIDTSAIHSGDSAGGDLSGTLPNPTVAKVNGHTVGSLSNSQVVVTDGSGNITSASKSGIDATAVHSGDSAGGDIGGTYPTSLTVTAIHETSGPTKLTIGSIADGQLAERSGTTFIGVNKNGIDGTAVHSGDSAAGGDLTGTYPTSINVAQAGGFRHSDGNVDVSASSKPGSAGLVLTSTGTTGAHWAAIGAGSDSSAVHSGDSSGGDLTGTYPTSLTVAAFHETSGPTKLTYGSISDGQLLERSGSTCIGVAKNGVDGTAIHSGDSTGGDLSGTYPTTLTVASFHETSGPTKLTYGTVSDGQYLKRSGSTCIGISAASIPISEWRKADSMTLSAATGTKHFKSGGDGSQGFVPNGNTDLGYMLRGYLTGNASTGLVMQVELNGGTTNQTTWRMTENGTTAASASASYSGLVCNSTTTTPNSFRWELEWAATGVQRQGFARMIRSTLFELNGFYYNDTSTNITDIGLHITTGDATGTVELWVRAAVPF